MATIDDAERDGVTDGMGLDDAAYDDTAQDSTPAKDNGDEGDASSWKEVLSNLLGMGNILGWDDSLASAASDTGSSDSDEDGSSAGWKMSQVLLAEGNAAGPEAAAAAASGTGINYDLPVENGSGDTTAAVAEHGNQGIDGLLSGVRWADGFITYSFPTAASQYQAGHPELFSNFQQINADQQMAAHFALNADLYTQPLGAAGFSVEGFTGLDISFTTGGAGTIRLANTSNPGTAYAYYPNNGVSGGDAFFGNSGRTPQMGNYHWHTVLHEIGHSLGLKHGQEAGGFGAMPANLDAMEYSVMTYRSYQGAPLSGYTNETFGYAQTYMMYDIAALQYMYGADFTTNSGNTSYVWNPTTGTTSVNGNIVITPGANRIFMTVWDGGGIDTYNFSAYSTNMSINLNPGSYSLVSSAQRAYLGNSNYANGNVYNALQYNGDARSLIENAIGGSGNDTIIGNQANNTLWGLGGNDYLNANAGNDTVYGGDGNDTIVDTIAMLSTDDDYYDGGAGVDTLIHNLSWVNTVDFNLNTGWSSFGGNRDRILNIENLTVGGSASVTGSNVANLLIVNGTGANAINALGGNDTVYAGGGDDTITDTEGMGAGDDDYYDGGAGIDTLIHDLNWVSGVAFNLNTGWSTYGGNRDRILNIENLTVGGAASVTGSGVANVLIVNGVGANAINAMGGRDTVNAGGGDDVITDTESIFADGSQDDVYDGGAGIDTLIHNLNWVDTVAFNLTTGWTTWNGNNHDRVLNIENLTVGGSASVTGSNVANVLIVNGTGSNAINAMGGRDTVNAGGGDDIITDTESIFADGSQDDVYDGGAGIDTLIHDLSWVSTVAFNLTTGWTTWNGENRERLLNIENLTVGGAASVTGSGVANVLIVNGVDANAINALGGNDSVYAGGGNDTVLAGTGNDYVFGDTGNDSLVGGGGIDTIYGWTGNDTIVSSGVGFYSAGDDNDYVYAGNGGAETLIGGAGIDWLNTVATGGNYAVNLATGATNIAGESFIEFENMIAGGGRDTITGTNGDNVIYGGAGNDSVNGGLGNDYISGDAGHDYLAGGDGTDSIFGGVGDDTIVSSGFGTYNGQDGNDYIYAGVGNPEVLIGGAGTDTLDTTLWAGDYVINLATGATNWAGESFTLFEHLVSGSGNDSLTGTAGGNRIWGGLGNDTIAGMDGADTLYGEDGNDRLVGGGSSDRLFGGAGNDTLIGDKGAEILQGDDGNDSLTGGKGNDTLIGGAGLDTLIGGDGADVFLFLSATDSDIATYDLISGFNGAGAGAGDLIDLAGVYSGTLTFGSNLWLENVGAESWVRVSTDVDVDAEMTIRIADGGTNAAAYVAADFVL